MLDGDAMCFLRYRINGIEEKIRRQERRRFLRRRKSTQNTIRHRPRLQIFRVSPPVIQILRSFPALSRRDSVESEYRRREPARRRQLGSFRSSRRDAERKDRSLSRVTETVRSANKEKPPAARVDKNTATHKALPCFFRTAKKSKIPLCPVENVPIYCFLVELVQYLVTVAGVEL